MALNIYNIKKWMKMLTGKSLLHVEQGAGRYYKKNEIAGYYNDLTEKVTRANLEVDELPVSSNENNKSYYFPIAIFQYGLGAYDLYLQTNDEKYLKIVKLAADWAVKNQNKDGGWVCFYENGEKNTYSSMGQGEGISLLARCNVVFGEKKYLTALKKAMVCMLKPASEGGTILLDGDLVFLKEYPEKPVVLNGWVFSIFGLHDYLLLFSKDGRVKDIYNKTIITLRENLKNFDLGYWSKYDIGNKIASPFYHKLHISLLSVLYDLTGENDFMLYAEKFKYYNDKKSYVVKAFVKKAFQKVMEK